MNALKAATYALATFGALAVLMVTLGGAAAAPTSPSCSVVAHLQGPGVAAMGQPVILQTVLSVSGANCHLGFAVFQYHNLPTNLQGFSGAQISFPTTMAGSFHPIVVVTTNLGTVAATTSLYVLPPN